MNGNNLKFLYYHEKHFDHDGCICGYDPEKKLYCIYAYDKNWIYQKFWTPRESFENGRKAQFKENKYGKLFGIKPTSDQIPFSSDLALGKIQAYLSSTLEKNPESGEGCVYGTAVLNYVVKYLDKLCDGSIPYEKMDRRIFRMIWEHKKALLECIRLIEDELSMDHTNSNSYIKIVEEANQCSWIDDNLNASTLFPEYDFWYARYYDHTPNNWGANDESDWAGTNRKFGMWQYTDKKHIAPITANTVDCDVAYKNYPLIIKSLHLNNF